MEIEDLMKSIDQYQGVTAGGIATLAQRMDQLETVSGRLQGGGNHNPDISEHQKAFAKWARRGTAEDELVRLQKSALNIGSDPDGGFAVPEQIDSTIEKLMLDISPIRAIARVVKVGTSDYKRLINTGGMASGWVGEEEARPETAGSTLAAVAPPLGEIYANPSATQQSLDDIFFDVEGFLSEDIAEEFAQQEGAAFVTGDGINKPRGILTYANEATADATRAFGTLEHIVTGQAGAWPTTGTASAEKLIDLVHSLRKPYRRGAHWVMNSTTLASIRKFKDTEGRFIWQQSLQADQPSMLLGYPITESEDFPDVGANSLSVAFGNFQKGYTIVDRAGTRVLRDPYTNKPYVHFYTTKRVGGCVMNSQAIKLLKFST